MELFRSISCRDVRVVKVHRFNGGGEMGPPGCVRYRRSYSAIHGNPTHLDEVKREMEMEEVESSVGSSSNKWGLIDPELQRKTRLARYKAYSVEGKLKTNVRRSFVWIKDACRSVIHR